MIKKINRGYSLIIVFSAVLIISLYYLDKYINDKLESQLITSLNDVSNQNIKLIQNEIENKLSILSSLANDFKGYTEEELKNSVERLNSINESFNFRELSIALPNGIAYINTGKIFDVSKRDYFQESINGNRYVSDRIIDQEDKSDVNVYSVPIFNDDSSEVIGILFASYDTEYFIKLLQVSSFEGNGYSYIINSKGDIITDSNKSGKIYQENLFDLLANSSETSEDKRLNYDAVAAVKKGINNNDNKIYVEYKYNEYKKAIFEFLDVNDWWLVTVVPNEIISNRIYPIINSVHIITIFVTFSAFAAIIYIINRDKKAKENLTKVAYIDSFTGLYNKNYLKEKLNYRYLKRKDLKSALVVLNVRNFKLINELYGLETGDSLIKKIALLLKEDKKEKEIVAHNNADEFVALYFYKSKEELEKRLKNISDKIKNITYNENKMFLEVYIGICEVIDFKNGFEKLYNYASIAKNTSKRNRDNSFTYYNKQLAKNELSEKKLENEIKEGILNKEFKAWFQPKYDCNTKEIVGCEALARWYKKDGKVYFPNEFIEISESRGFIKEIDKLLFEDVCMNIKEWKRRGIKVVPVSINVSRAYLNNTEIVYDLREILNKYSISPEYIQIEITESSLVKNEEMLNKIINEMHRCGFQVSLDDFGVGYSSLNSISKLKFDTLKIDKSFVDAIGTISGNYILKYSIELGKNLGMEVLVEGVENEEQYQFLKKNNCNTIQGYYFSKPLDKNSFEKLLET
ncbi:EAL domain-containing protein [Clostridium sp. Sa3CUN1]|uniref:EAL domain-containing protein n=1 Tax=Clostridium gallinarum TaxID=2762246 RepID=A0ABR8Q6A5_9CLOT|nr:EAL domain-containing protein [Clostridium gallinarum]MBD7915964.1 EAL domain-containing protein [Clostridium gallinarum]